MERIAIVGIGKIGLCMALNLERAGHDVLGVDKNRDHVDRVNLRTFRTVEPGVEAALATARAFRATHDLAPVPDFAPTTIIVAVDTPTTEGAGYDTGRVDTVMRDLFALGHAPSRTDLVLACTTAPGYGDSRAAAAEAFGYALSYSPAFVAQGSILRDQQRPDIVLIGEADAAAGDRLERVFRRMCLNEAPVHRMSRLSAEIAKLATNCFLTMKIAFANAIGDLATSVSAEPERVLAAVGGDARIGTGFLRYGFGFGGPCLPRDNRALNFFAKQHACELLQGEATDEMNRRHLAFQVSQHLRAPEDAPIHFHSVAYKPGTEILDESQPLALAAELARTGRRVVIHGTEEVVLQLRARFGALFEYEDPANGAIRL